MKSSVYIYVVFISLFTFCSTNLFAQDLEEEVRDVARVSEEETKDHAFIIDAQLRTRGEYRHGAIAPLGKTRAAAYFVNERSRLSVGYASNGVQLQVSAQHAGVWGNQKLSGSNNGFSVNEAWGQIETNNHLFSARVGRQSLSYDNGRILGSNDWTTAGNFHNALKLSYEDEWHKVHIIGALNQSQERSFGTYFNDSTGLYKNMQALWYHFGNMSFPLQVSVLAMNTAYEAGGIYVENNVYKQTFGGNITFDTYHFGAELEGYYQMGKENPYLKTKAWMAAANFRYTANNFLTFKAGYDYLSGTDRDAKDNASFLPTLGSMHNFHGAMDYFAGNYFKYGHSGVSDAHAAVEWNAFKNFDVTVNYHFLSTSSDMIQLSNEIDLNIDWRFKNDVTLTGGFSYALNTPNMDVLLGGTNQRMQYFAFLQLNFSPRILFHKW